jgi:4-amino-4-deoxy-L-arabinose transferase-like glycosyltransferase
MKRWKRVVYDSNLWHRIALVAVLIFALYLRFVNLAWNPGWYADEGSVLDIARNLAEGRQQYFALGGTPLIAARVPLFHYILVGAFTLWGYDILTARLVVALFNVLTIVLLYWAARQMLDRRVALLAALVLTIMPNVLVYQRIAFAYNVQAFFYVLAWWALWKFAGARRARWLAIAALAVSAAYMTALTGLGLVVGVLLIVGWYAPRHLGWMLALMALPGILYLGALFISAPNALLEDLMLQSERSGGGSIGWQIFDLAWNYSVWLDWTSWIGLGIVGLILLEERRLRAVTLVIFFTTMLNAMRMLPGDLSFHRYLELVPFIALGVANFLLRAQRFLSVQFQNDWAIIAARIPFLLRFAVLSRVIIALMVGGLLFIPLAWSSLWNYYAVSSRESPLATRLDWVLVRKPSDAVVVTDYVNQQTRRDDVVLASPALAWRLHARAADFEQMLAFDGKNTQNYGKGIARARFAFAPTLDNATFVIVDNLWRGWATQHMPALRENLQIIESWPLVLQRGDFQVYRNPAR